MTTKCSVCKLPTLMGIHTLCLQNSIRAVEEIQLSEERPSVCAHCPFRKDGPQWLDRGRLLLNQFRLRRFAIQHCVDDHIDFYYRGRIGCKPKPRLCLGQTICSLGGNSQVYSREEFLELSPIPPEDVYNAFKARDEG